MSEAMEQVEGAGGFALTAAPAASCSAGEFADRHGYTAPAVVKWIKRKGMPATYDRASGRWSIDPSVGDAWFKANITEGAGHGGKRGRSGRKPRADKTPADPAIAEAALREKQEREQKERERTSDFLRGMNPGATDFLAVGAAALSVTDVDKVKKLQEVQERDRAARLEAGELVRAEDVVEKWGELVAPVVARLMALPMRFAEAACTEVGAPMEKMPVLAAKAEAMLREAMAEISGGVREGGTR